MPNSKSRESDGKTVQIEFGSGRNVFYPLHASPSSLESFTASFRQITTNATQESWKPYTILEDGIHGLSGDGNDGFFLCLLNQGVRIELAPTADTEIMMEYSASH